MQSWMSEASLDRADNRRKVPEWVSEQWRRPEAQLLLVDAEGHIATNEEVTGPRGVAPDGDYDAERHTFLGLVEGVPWFTTEGSVTGARASLRHLGAVAVGAGLELAVGAVALIAWHRLEPYCPGCGALTTVTSGGLTRRCSECKRVQFPRTDPAVIMAVIDDQDRILLGRQASWDDGRMSVLAGFVDAGESLEQAVHREVFEETGVRLGEVRYFGSQPWPFPRSLMVGFVADAVSTDITIDKHEIDEAAWFSRAELAAALSERRVIKPGSASIAHRLITAWQGRLLG